MSDEALMPVAEFIDPAHRTESEERLLRFAQLKHTGLKRVELCRIMDITPPTHDRWAGHPVVIKYLEQLRLTAETRVLLLKDRLNLEVQDIIEELLAMSRDEATPRAVRASIKQDLLDRQGDLPKHAVQHNTAKTVVLSDAQFERIFGGAHESALITQGGPALGADEPKRIPENAS